MTAELTAQQTGIPAFGRSFSSTSDFGRSTVGSSPMNFSSRPGTGASRSKTSFGNNRGNKSILSLRLPKMPQESILSAPPSADRPETFEATATSNADAPANATSLLSDTKNSLSGSLSGTSGKPELRPVSPGLQRLLLSMDPPSPILSKKEKHALACQSVSDQAFRRCLYNAEKAIDDDLFMDATLQERERNALRQEQLRRDKQREDLMELKMTLDDQIEYQEKVRRLPPPASSTSLQIEDNAVEQRAENKRDLLQYLRYQITNKRESSEQAKMNKLIEESRFLDHVAMEFDLKNVEERAKHLELQHSLLEDWERAAHINNLKKLKGKDVVHRYITTKFMDKMNSGASEDRSQSQGFGGTDVLDMSVGYDSRRA